MQRPVPDEVILGLLKAKPAHGYGLLESFRSREHLGRVWTMSTSQLYAVLDRLEETGAIIGRQITAQEGPPRIEYSVTKLGEQQLLNWLYQSHPSVSIHRIRVMFLSRLYIAEKLGMSVKKIVATQKAVCVEQLKKLDKERASVGSPIEKLTLDFVIGQLASALAWLETCIYHLS